MAVRKEERVPVPSRQWLAPNRLSALVLDDRDDMAAAQRGICDEDAPTRFQ